MLLQWLAVEPDGEHARLPGQARVLRDPPALEAAGAGRSGILHLASYGETMEIDGNQVENQRRCMKNDGKGRAEQASRGQSQQKTA